MSVENLVLQENQTPNIDKTEAYRQEFDRLIGVCEAEFNLDDIRGLIDFLDQDPNLSDYIREFQKYNGELLKSKIIETEAKAEQEREKETDGVQIQENIIEASDKYSFVSEYLEKVSIGSGELEIFNNDIFSALRRYGDNQEPLLNLLGDKEKLNKFLEFLESDKGKQILEFSGFYQNITTVGDALQIVNLDTNEPGKDLSLEVLNHSQNLISRINKHQNTLHNELKAQRESQNMKGAIMAGNYGITEWANYSYDNFENKVTTELHSYAKDVFKSILSSSGALELLKSGENFTLPIGENKVSLDFSELPNGIDFEKLTENQINELTEKYFEDVYIDDFSEKLVDVLGKLKDYALNHPEKLFVDVASIIASGLVAVGSVATVSASTGGLGAVPSVALAGTTFTATDNAIRTFGYGVIGEMGWDSIDGEKDFSEGALEGIGLKEEDLNLETVVTKKGFETLSNTVLFGIFNRTGRLAEIGAKALEKKGIEVSLTTVQKTIFEASKTIPEAVFFTYYGVGATAIEETILAIQKENGLNRDEAIDFFLDNIGKIKDIDTFTHYFMYNLGFIGLVKAGGGFWQGNFESKLKELPADMNIKSMIDTSTKIDMEVLRLEDKGYTASKESNGEIVFYDRNLNKADIMKDDFANLRALQESLMVSTVNIHRLVMNDNPNNALPNSGKGTKAQSNKPINQVKYERLEKLSKEAENSGLNFALDKGGIYEGISKSGVKEGTKDGLLKEAGFERNEIDAIKRKEVKEGSKKLEDRAVERMNNAVEVISKDFNNVIDVFLNNKGNIKDFRTELETKGYNKNQVTQLIKLILNKKR